MSSAIEVTDDLFELDPKDEAVAEFVAELGRSLQRILVQEKTKNKLTQQALAEKLGISRSRVNRCFSGYANLTASSMAELAWALGYKACVEFRAVDEHPYSSQVYHLQYRPPEQIDLAAIKVPQLGQGDLQNSVWVVLPESASRRPETSVRTAPKVEKWQIA